VFADEPGALFAISDPVSPRPHAPEARARARLAAHAIRLDMAAV
jgi:hypothetical protein